MMPDFLRKLIHHFIGFLLVVALFLFIFLFPQLLFSLKANAASILTYNSSITWSGLTKSYESGTVTYTVGQSANLTNTQIRYTAPNSPSSAEFINGNSFTVSIPIMTNSPYSTAVTSRPIDISCPILDSRFNTTDCQVSVVEQVMSERHYLLWNFVITGTINVTNDSNVLIAYTNIKNLSSADATIWFLPPQAAFGEGSFQVLRNILGNSQQMNLYLSGISTAFTNNNNYLSAIQALQQQILEKMDSANVSGVISQQQRTNQLLQDQAEQAAQDRQNATSQQTTLDSTAASSGEEAEDAGTTLLAAFSAFVDIFKNASPSNCVINMDLGNLDLGEVDLCTLSPPAPLQAIGSILLIGFCVPLSIATATKMINLFRSFSG